MVVLAMLATAALVGIAIGVIPSVQVMRAQVNEVLREESRSGTGGRRSHRARQILVVAQVGLAFVLLAGAGLVLASFRQLLMDRVLPAIRSIPDVQAAGATTTIPWGGDAHPAADGARIR